MFMGVMFLGDAIGYALALTFVVAAISLFLRPNRDAKNMWALGAEFVLSLITNAALIWAILWWGLPTHTGTLGGYAWVVWPLLVAGLIFTLIDLAISDWKQYGASTINLGFGGPIALVLFFVIAIYSGCNAWTVRNQGGATKLATLIAVDRKPSDVYPETDTNHMVKVPEENARLKASQIMGKDVPDDNDKNKRIQLSTRYRYGKPELQKVQDHLYWIIELSFVNRKIWNQVGKTIPGYIAVDAEDPDAEAQMKLGYKMRFTPSAWYTNKLERRIYAEYADYVVDDLTLEVDDNWKPYYTAALDKKLLHNSGTVPVAMIIIDPDTGKIERHELDDIPEWVDRIYSKETAREMVNWWGNYGNPEQAPFCNFCNRSTQGRFRVNGDPVLVYTKTGFPAWQMTITSMQSDNSILGLILFDTRDNRAEVYSIIDGKATENAVKTVFESIQENVRGDYQATHLSLHKIYGTPTWVASYIHKSGDSSQGDTIVGIGFVSALDLQGKNVAFSKNSEEALSKYRQILARTPDVSAPGESVIKQQSTKGTLASIVPFIENGNTVYLLVLVENPTRVFKAPAGTNSDLIELAFAKPGDAVVVNYTDVGQTPIDLRQFNDLDVKIVP